MHYAMLRSTIRERPRGRCLGQLWRVVRPEVTTYGPALVIEASSITYFTLKWGVQKGPLRRVELSGTAPERAGGLARCIAPRHTGPEFLATCAPGQKTPGRTGIFGFSSSPPLVSLYRDVFDETASKLDPIFDIESCIGWGHLLSLRGCLDKDSPPTLILTLGDDVYESLWVNSEVFVKENLVEGHTALPRTGPDVASSDGLGEFMSTVAHVRQFGVERVVINSGLRD